MTSQTDTFNPQEFCSRKLWDIVTTDNSQQQDKALLDAAIAELQERRSYLQELQIIGKSSVES